MGTVTFFLALAALGIAIAAYFKKSKTVVEYRSDLTLRTETRIQKIESDVKIIGSVLTNYDLKPKKK